MLEIKRINQAINMDNKSYVSALHYKITSLECGMQTYKLAHEKELYALRERLRYAEMHRSTMLKSDSRLLLQEMEPEGEVQRLRRRIGYLQSERRFDEVQRYFSETKSFTEVIDSFKAEIDDLNGVISSKNDDIAQRDRQIADVRVQMRELLDKRDQDEQNSRMRESELDAYHEFRLTAAREHMELQSSAFRAKICELEQAVAERDACIGDLRRDYGILTRELQHTRERVQQAYQTQRELVENAKNANYPGAALETAAGAYNETRRLMAVYQAQIEALQQQIAHYRVQMAKSEAAYTTELQKAHQDAQLAQSRAALETQRMLAQQERAEQTLTLLRERALGNAQDLKAQLQTCTGVFARHIADLTTEHRDLTTYYEALLERFGALCSIVSAATKRVETHDATCDARAQTNRADACYQADSVVLLYPNYCNAAMQAAVDTRVHGTDAEQASTKNAANCTDDNAISAQNSRIYQAHAEYQTSPRAAGRGNAAYTEISAKTVSIAATGPETAETAVYAAETCSSVVSSYQQTVESSFDAQARIAAAQEKTAAAARLISADVENVRKQILFIRNMLQSAAPHALLTACDSTDRLGKIAHREHQKAEMLRRCACEAPIAGSAHSGIELLQMEELRRMWNMSVSASMY